ncbi:alpha/beta hydrolase [Actinoplanes auranticolor]|uniref:Esterase n=1 Tax=Actinoplanes auranticolor TaxID=47988 RepID=A0A919VMA8_9ACTN|nr:alpha/beta hydrolase fold domain-containing protein [Actinoplanes auranticolor]GIM68787.1 esterase [Actinoplanes auranticolor]
MTDQPAQLPSDGVTFDGADLAAVDPELREPLPAIMAATPRPLTLDVLPARRALGAELRPADELLSRDGRITLESRQAGETGVLIARPAGVRGPLPGVVYLHGGGMIAGDERSDLPGVLDWVEQAGVVLVSVDYRLAPEHPYPAAVEDCHAALAWTVAHAEELGIDGRVVLAGTSAGGGLAAGTALLHRDRGGAELAGLLLRCPMLDDRNVDAPVRPYDTWSSVSNLTGWTAVLGAARGGPDVSPYAAPARATDLSGLPPTFIDVGTADIFLDEDVAFAQRIWAAGGRADLHVWAGGYHAFDHLVMDAQISREARASRVGWLQRILAPAS